MTARCYRPTTLALVERHCPRALDFHEAAAPTDRAPFEVGIAAHAVLQAVAEATNARNAQLDQGEVETVANETAARLIAAGRTFDGKLEPPLSPDRALEGRDLAVAHLAHFWPMPGARVEVGLAMNAAASEVAYRSPDARLRAVLDYAHVEEVGGEEEYAKVLRVVDYKSAWSADERELYTVQRKAQAVLAALHFAREPEGENPTVLRLEVHNLRTHQVHALDVPLDPGAETLDRWRADLLSTMDALDAQAALGMRPASPGAGCLGCPYLLRCDHAQEYLRSVGMPGTADQRAVAYAVAEATLDQLGAAVRQDCDEGWIAVPGGRVGFLPQERRKATATAYAEVWTAWEERQYDGRGFAKAAKLGAGNLEAIAKVLYPERTERADREAFVASLVEPETVKRFGVEKVAIEQGESSESAA